MLPLLSAELEAKRRPPLATCAVGLAGGWGLKVTAAHTSRGSPALGRAVPERSGSLGPGHVAGPSSRPPQPRGGPRQAPVRLRVGGGAAHGHPPGHSLPRPEREPAANQPRRVRATGRGAQGRSATPGVSACSTRWPGLADPPPGTLEQGVESTRDQLAVEHALPVLLPETEGPWCGRAGRCHNTPRAASWRSACGLLRCFGGLCLPSASRPRRCAEEGASISIKRVQAAAPAGHFVRHDLRAGFVGVSLTRQASAR
jgi:hypothetical protein